jgi:flagellar basal-body rod protein FlgC
MDFDKTLTIAAAGMRAQTERMKVIAENIANANSTAHTSSEDPYRRQVPTFANELDKAMGLHLVKVDGTINDMSEFRRQYNPGHPAADKDGYVKLPNVNPLVEMMDMREAQRSYEANVTVIDAGRTMMARTLDLLKR